MSARVYPIDLPEDGEPRLFRLTDDLAIAMQAHGFERPTGRDQVELADVLHRWMFGVPAPVAEASEGRLPQPEPGACPRCARCDRRFSPPVDSGVERLWCARCDRRFSLSVGSERAA